MAPTNAESVGPVIKEVPVTSTDSCILFPLLVVTFLPLQYENLDVFFEGGIILDNMTSEYGCPFSITVNESQKNSCWRPVNRLTLPFRKFLPFSEPNLSCLLIIKGKLIRVNK